MVARILFAGLMALVVVSGSLFQLAGYVETMAVRREHAENRWAAQPLAGYRMVVQVERARAICYQELEVRGPQSVLMVRDTCSPSWLSNLTITRMFELSRRLELPPECLPSTRDCICQRERVGQVEYDAAMGYPQMITWQREMRPNWQNLAFWLRAWETRAMPACTTVTLPVRVIVLGLTPLS